MTKTSKNPTMSVTQRQVFIVDDHPITRRGLTQLINAEPDLKVCGESDNAITGLEDIKRMKPDIVLVDITLPRRWAFAIGSLLLFRVWWANRHRLSLRS